MNRFPSTLLRLAILLISASLFPAAAAEAVAGQKFTNLLYKTGEALSDYEKERCCLDLYLPKGKPGFATLVWFHGGGLKEGRKDDTNTVKIAESLVKGGLAVVAVNYRLSPKATYPAYVEDAAAAFAWTFSQISQYGGDSNRVFVGGHSAGGYLTAMLGMDARYLQKFGLTPRAIAGLIPVSGQMMTHYTIREERGTGRYNITADEAAPIHFARKETPPLLVLYADQDMASRAEENQFFVSVLKAAGNKMVTETLIRSRTHSEIGHRIAESGDPARQAILDFIQKESKVRIPTP